MRTTGAPSPSNPEMNEGTNPPLRILHISSTFTAGVYEAIRQYVQNSPQLDHHLLVERRESVDLPSIRSLQFLGPRLRSHAGEVRRAVHSIAPDVIHAHSSWAGMWARTNNCDVPVVYQPHALASEGYASAPGARYVFSAAERILARNTRMFVALSRRELTLLKRLARHRPVNMLHNTAALSVSHSATWSRPTTPRFAMVGRISAQKDPAFFAELARAVRAHEPSAEFVWIGDGDTGLKLDLEQAGVRVTGWIDKARVAEELSNLTLYLHTARYEGFPLSVLDAALVGAPTSIRDAAWSEGIDLPRFGSVPQAVHLCQSVMERPELFEVFAASSRALTSRHSAEQQARDLNTIYRTVSTKKGS